MLNDAFRNFKSKYHREAVIVDTLADGGAPFAYLVRIEIGGRTKDCYFRTNDCYFVYQPLVNEHFGRFHKLPQYPKGKSIDYAIYEKTKNDSDARIIIAVSEYITKWVPVADVRRFYKDHPKAYREQEVKTPFGRQTTNKLILFPELFLRSFPMTLTVATPTPRPAGQVSLDSF